MRAYIEYRYAFHVYPIQCMHAFKHIFDQKLKKL